MRSAIFLPIIVGVSVIVAGSLYLFGGPAFQRSILKGDTDARGITTDPTNNNQEQKGFTVLAKGQNATTIDERVNYRITDPDQFATLWQMIYTANGPGVPIVDFEREEVLALFDGSHSTGGYAIALKNIEDRDGQRIITLIHTEPGDSCITSATVTSPFVIVKVPKSPLSIERNEVVDVTSCP